VDPFAQVEHIAPNHRARSVDRQNSIHEECPTTHDYCGEARHYRWSIGGRDAVQARPGGLPQARIHCGCHGEREVHDDHEAGSRAEKFEE